VASRTAEGRIRVPRGAQPAGLRAISIGGLVDGAPGGPPGDGFRPVRPEEEPPTGLSTGFAPAGAGPGGAGSPGGYPEPGAFGDPAGPLPCTCGRRNPATARFCPCGQLLVRIEPGTRRDADRAPEPRGGWRPLLTAGENSRFDRALRAAGPTAGYSQPLAARTSMFRTVAAAGTVAILLALVGPWSGSSRGWISDQAAGLIPHSYREIDVASEAVDPPQQDLDGYLPLFAVDGFRNRAWATAWHPERAGATACPAQGAGSATLVLTFKDPATVDRVSIRAGLDDKSPDRLTQVRPKTIGIQLEDGPCQTLALSNTADPQALDVHATGVSSARVWVVDAYPSPDGPSPDGPGDRVAISEIDFLAKR
jgi:hypothetical protein